MNRQLIFVSGYSKLPEGTIAYEIYGGLIVALVVDKKTGVIIRAECSLATELAVEFIENLLVGVSLNAMEDITAKLNSSYYGAAKKAILSALNICAEKFIMISQNQHEHVHDETYSI